MRMLRFGFAILVSVFASSQLLAGYIYSQDGNFRFQYAGTERNPVIEVEKKSSEWMKIYTLDLSSDSVAQFNIINSNLHRIIAIDIRGEDSEAVSRLVLAYEFDGLYCLIRTQSRVALEFEEFNFQTRIWNTKITFVGSRFLDFSLHYDNFSGLSSKVIGTDLFAETDELVSASEVNDKRLARQNF